MIAGPLQSGRALRHELLHGGGLLLAQADEGLDPPPLLLQLAVGSPGGEEHGVDRGLEGDFEVLVFEGRPGGLDREPEIQRIEPARLDELRQGGIGVAVAHVQITRGGVGEVVERSPQLGEVDHVDGAVELTPGFENVRHAEGVGGLEVAPLELAVEIVDALLAAHAFGLVAQMPLREATGSQRSRAISAASDGRRRRAQTARNFDQFVDHRRVRSDGLIHDRT